VMLMMEDLTGRGVDGAHSNALYPLPRLLCSPTETFQRPGACRRPDLPYGPAATSGASGAPQWPTKSCRCSATTRHSADKEKRKQ
jgi:hypothetical protein